MTDMGTDQTPENSSVIKKSEVSDMELEQTPKFVNKVSNEAKLKELLRNITSNELKLCKDASKEFIKLLKGDSGGELLKLYVKSSSMCSEIVQAWKLRQGKSGLSYVLTLVSVILSHYEGMYRVDNVDGVVSRALDKFAKLIVDEKMEDLYKELKSKDPKRQKAVLLLLASIVRRGSGLASDVANRFDFKLPVFPKLAEYRKRERGVKTKKVTRKAFVGFAMSFLEVGKPGLLRGVLTKREMYMGVLRGLGSDDDETVVYVLLTLRDKILKEESLVPPGLRSVLFGSVTLDQLINISGRDNGGLATEIAQHVLSFVCTDPSNGLMPDIMRRPPLTGNLTRLLGVLKKLRATEIEYHRVLLLAIVKGKPSFGSAYLDEFPYNLEDHASSNWFSAISLAADVVSSVSDGVSFDFLNTQTQESTSFHSSDVQSIIKCICPRPFTRLVINKGLLHSNSLIKHGTLRLVFEAMKLLDSFVRALNSSSGSGSQMRPGWASLKKDIEEEVCISLPDPQVLLSLISSLNSHYKSPKICQKRASSSENVLESNISRSKKRKTSNADDETDIIVGGISSLVGVSSPVDTEDLVTNSLDELDDKEEHMKIIAKIWGVHCNTASMTLNDEDTYFYSKLLDTLKLYYITAPTMLEGSFDFFKILPSNALELPSILQQSLLSLLIEYIGWSAECELPVRVHPLMYKHLPPLLNLLLYSPAKDIKEQAYILAKAAMSSSGAFDHNLREIGTWFLFLPGYGNKNLILDDHWINMYQDLFSAVVKFLCNAVSTMGNNLFKNWDYLRCHIYDLTGRKDLIPDFSPLVLCILENCLKLLRSKSKINSLPKKTMISLYVSNTLMYLLQTQVESGLLSSVITKVLSESSQGIDASLEMCEWRPLKKLSAFLESITYQQSCRNSPSLAKDAILSESSLVNTIDNIKIVAGSHASELAGVTAAFSFSMLCTTPAELLQNFPSVIALSENFLRVPLMLLLSTFFSEQSLFGDISKLWPEMFFDGLQRATCATHSEEEHKYIIDNTHSVECSSVAFGSLLKQAPFHVLFPALVSIESSHLLDNIKLQDLLLAKLSEGMADIYISYVPLVLFWFHQTQSSYRHKTPHDLKKISELCSTVLKNLVLRIVSVGTGSCSNTSRSPLPQYVQELPEIVFSHPAVLASLEHPFTVSQESTDEISRVSLEDIFGLAKQGIHTMDYHVWNLVATTSDHLFTFCNHQKSQSEFDTSYVRIIKAFNSLVKKLFLILKDKFDQWLKTKDVAPLVPTLYALHSLLPYISPFTLLELVRYIFSKVDLNDSGVWSDTKPVLCIGLSIAGHAFDLLSAYLRDPYMKQKQFGLWGEEKVIDICLFEEIYFHVIEIALRCELDVSDICLLKAVNVAKTSKLVQNQCLSQCLVVLRVIASTPNKLLTSCIRKISMSKANFLFVLTEVSPLHMSVFGHLFSEMMAEYMLLKGKNMQACSHTLSDDGILILLPTFLSYLSSTSIKSGNRYSKTLTNIMDFYWELLSHGFSTWKDYVWRDIFQVEFGDIGSSSLVEILSFFNDSLLGKTILMVHYYLASTGNSVKLEKRFELYKSVLCTSGAHVLLDCEVNEIDGYSNNQSVNLLCKTIAKIEYCRKLLFPEDNEIHSVSLQGKDGGKSMGVVPSEVGYEELRIQFIENLVCAWQSLVKKFPFKKDNFGEVKGTNNHSLFRLLEDFILKNILQLTSEMGKNVMKLDSLKKLVKSSLLYRFQDPTVFRMLQGVTSTVDKKKSRDLIIKLLLAHSQFAPTIAAASKSYNNSHFGIVLKPMSSILRCYRNQDSVASGKSFQSSDLYMNLLEVLKLLRILLHFRKPQDDKSFEEDIGINAKELLAMLLSAYGATLSDIDLEIYNLIHVIESTIDMGSSYIAEMDYLWGFAALKVRKERDKEHNASIEDVDGVEAVDERRRNQFRENLPVDPKLCTNTVLYFPYDRTIGEGTSFFGNIQHVDTLHIEAYSRNVDKPPMYDPVYILQFSIHNLSMGYIEPLEFASFGLLAVAFTSLSSPWEEIRKLGYEAIGRFKNSLERSPKRKDVTRLCLLLTYLQNGIVKSWQRIPSVTAMFVAEASFILLDPSNEHYIPISKLLVGSSRVNLECIPMFDNYFWSSSVNYKSERMWVLRLLCSGLNIEDDAQLYIRNSVPDTLLSFYSSPLSDDESRDLLIEIVVKSTKLHKLSHYLIKQCGLISWLSSIISNCCDRQHNQRSLSSTQLTVILQVVNDVLTCNHTIEWLQKGALEQLTELTSHLYKLLDNGIDLVKKNIPLGSLILRIFKSALRISQKRDVYQPHFTLSAEGIYQIYKAAHAFSDGRYNPTAEEGLEVILMNTPPVDFLCMNQEKLLKFVQWAISTAIHSDSSRMLQPRESYHHKIMSLGEKEREESLTSKLLRWFTASVIRGLLSQKFKCLSSSLIHKQSSPVTLHTLIDQIERGREEKLSNFDSEEMFAAVIYHLQQLLGRKCIVIPSVVSALCLICCESGFLVGHAEHLESLLRRIHFPHEANPAWRWLFDHQWKDNSYEPSEAEKLDESQACRSLLVLISGILGRKSSLTRSYEDMENCELFKWERTMLEQQ